ncbi:MAG: hypothetical protein ACFFAH_14975 [Promethearchaeota archaeon]
MREINFITIGDNNYFPFIHFSIKQVLKFYPTSKLFIYDWGFTPFQKKKISTYPNTILIDWTNNLDREHGYKTIKAKLGDLNLSQGERKSNYLYNQKPICMLDCAKRIKENLIFFDGDAILINPIDEIFNDDFDIGVTILSNELIRIAQMFLKSFYEKIPETREVITFAKKLQEIDLPSYTMPVLKDIGNLNSGVIFFKLDSIKMQFFIQEWMEEIKSCNVHLTEQYSLFNLIKKKNKEIFDRCYNTAIITISNESFKVKSFSAMIYNYIFIKGGYNDKKVKFIHFLLVKDLYLGRKNRFNAIRNLINEIKFHRIYYKLLRIFPPIIRHYIKKIFNTVYLLNLVLHPLNYYWIKRNRDTIIRNIKNIRNTTN